MTYFEVISLVVAGLLVGFINTLAGGGSVISLSVLMLLGLSPSMANGTNRIAITIQTFTASLSFKKQNVLETKTAIRLAIPEIIGSLLGAWIAVDIPEWIFKRAMGVILLFMLVLMSLKPQKYLYGKSDGKQSKLTYKSIILFFFIGLYGGFIHVGVGYILLAGIILGLGKDLVKANAIKVFMVLLYAPFTLLIFLLNDQVNWSYGLIMTIGNVVGALIAARLAVKKGVEFIRWVVIVVILITSMQLLGIVDLGVLFQEFRAKGV
ncbi:MAG: sulfite exporter TauE/SafE family protein [Bacteroidales bacterium]